MKLRCIPGCAALLMLLLPAAAHASFLHGETLDTAADWLSWIIIFLVPALAIGGFLFVHVLPEKIAEKRHHPHKDSIKVLCILSLFFGGLLWPFAWLWAYTKPVGYKAVYGTEKHDDYYLEMEEQVHEGKLEPERVAALRAELAAMQAKAPLSPALQRLSDRLDGRTPGAPPLHIPTREAETAAGRSR